MHDPSKKHLVPPSGSQSYFQLQVSHSFQNESMQSVFAHDGKVVVVSRLPATRFFGQSSQTQPLTLPFRLWERWNVAVKRLRACTKPKNHQPSLPLRPKRLTRSPCRTMFPFRLIGVAPPRPKHSLSLETPEVLDFRNRGPCPGIPYSPQKKCQQSRK